MSTVLTVVGQGLHVLDEGRPRDAVRSALAGVVCATTEGLTLRRARDFLADRGYAYDTVVSLAEVLLPVVRAAGLDRPYDPATADPSRPVDDIDRVLDCLAAGMSTFEIATALASQGWPDPAALTVMTGLLTT